MKTICWVSQRSFQCSATFLTENKPSNGNHVLFDGDIFMKCFELSPFLSPARLLSPRTTAASLPHYSAKPLNNRFHLQLIFTLVFISHLITIMEYTILISRLILLFCIWYNSVIQHEKCDWGRWSNRWNVRNLSQLMEELQADSLGVYRSPAQSWEVTSDSRPKDCITGEEEEEEGRRPAGRPCGAHWGRQAGRQAEVERVHILK